MFSFCCWLKECIFKIIHAILTIEFITQKQPSKRIVEWSVKSLAKVPAQEPYTEDWGWGGSKARSLSNSKVTVLCSWRGRGPKRIALHWRFDTVTSKMQCSCCLTCGTMSPITQIQKSNFKEECSIPSYQHTQGPTCSICAFSPATWSSVGLQVPIPGRGTFATGYHSGSTELEAISTAGRIWTLHDMAVTERSYCTYWGNKPWLP